eukprot:10691249-Heterocapsa_arctica.AAC.1
MQAGKKDKTTKQQRQVMEDEGNEDTRQQCQGYLDQQEDREIEQKRIDQNNENEQKYKEDRNTHAEAENNTNKENISDNIMDGEQHNISHNNKRAKISGNSQKGVNTYSLVSLLNKRKAEANIDTQAPLQKKSKAKPTSDSSSSQAVGTLGHLFQIQKSHKAIVRGSGSEAERAGAIEPVIELTMNIRREARGLGASA